MNWKFLILLCALSTAHSANLLIHDGTIHTISGAVIDHGDVLIQNGEIAAVGRDLPYAGDTTVIEARGAIVTPGLWAAVSGIGVVEVGLESDTVDSALEGDKTHPAFDVSDAYNANSVLVGINRIEGLTQTMVAPSFGGSVFAGRGRIADLSSTWDAIDRTGPGVLFAILGAAGGSRSGDSRAGALMELRAWFDMAKWLGGSRRRTTQIRAQWPDPLEAADMKALLPFASGKGRVAFYADRESDIRQAIALSHTYGFKAVIVGGAEAWRVADELAAERVGVVMDSLRNGVEDFDSLGARLDAAARLHHAGVMLGIYSSGGRAYSSHNARKARQAAGNAVAHGLPWDAALSALTLGPAQIWGVQDRYGTLSPGKVANLVIWDGDPLEVTGSAREVIIRGNLQPMESRQTRLRDHYLSPDHSRKAHR